jgi:hypothetical protein
MAGSKQINIKFNLKYLILIYITDFKEKQEIFLIPFYSYNFFVL